MDVATTKRVLQLVLRYPVHGGLHQQPGDAVASVLGGDLGVPDVHTVCLSLVQQDTVTSNLNSNITAGKSAVTDWSYQPQAGRYKTSALQVCAAH